MDIIDKIALGESIEPSNEERLSKVSEELGVNPEWVSSAIQFESKWDPNATNPLSGAKGLIQFTNTTAKEMGYENAEDLAKKHPTIESQISGPVKDYLKKKGPFKDERDFYLSIFYPAGRNLPDDTKLPDNVRKLNPGINTVGDYAKMIKGSVASGDLDISDVEPGQGDVLDKMLFPDLFDDFEYSEYGELLPQPQAQQQMDQPAFQGGKAEPSKASGPLDFESKYAIPFQSAEQDIIKQPTPDVKGQEYAPSQVLKRDRPETLFSPQIQAPESGEIREQTGGREIPAKDSPIGALTGEAIRSLKFQKPDVLTEQRMKDFPVETVAGEIAGQVVPAFAGGAGLQKTLLGIPQVARLASAGKWGKTAFSAVTRSVASGTDFAIRSKEELTSTDPVVQKKAIGRLATVIAASAASPLPEEFLPKGYIQPFAQAAADLVVQVAGDKAIGEDSFSEENIVNTIAGTITSGLFALNDIRKPNVAPKAKPEVTPEARPEAVAEIVRPDTKPDVDFEFKPEEPEVKAEQKPKPEVPKTETVETPDIDKADVPRVQTDTESSQKKAVPASPKTEAEDSPSGIPEDAIPLPSSKDDPSYFEVPEAGPARGSLRIGPGEKTKPETPYRKQRPAKAFAEFYKRHFTKPGDLGSDVQAEKIAKSGKINKELKEVEYVLSDFRKAVKKEYGTTKLNKNTLSQLDEALKNEKLISSLPESIQPHVRTMRNHIDLLSKRLIDLGVVEGGLVATIKENLGAYATRSYRVFDDPKWAKHVKEKAPGLIERAKAFLRKELEIQNEDLLDGKINELLSMKGGPIDFLISSGKIGSMNRSILKHRKDIPIEIRALWGEYKEPEVNYAKSVSKMISLIANHEFLNNVRKIGEGKFLFSPEHGPVVKGDKSYHVKISAEGNPSLKPLDGMYTSEEFKKAFENQNEPIRNGLLRAYMKGISIVKIGKTVLNPSGQVRNVVSNTGFALANGHLNVAAPGKKLLKLAKNRAEYRTYMKRLTELGVIGDGAHIGEIRAVLRDANMSDLDMLVDKTTQNMLRKPLQLAEKAYSWGDDIWKIYAFENEMARYKKALPDMKQGDLEKKVAGIVRDAYPTYSNIPEAIKKLRRLPLVGTFVSFQWEVLRTAGNTMRLIKTELSDPKTKAIGIQRLAGLLTAASITPTITAISRYANNVTKEDDKDSRKFLPEWSRNQPLFWTGNNKDGTGEYVDLGYTDPYAYFRAPVIALMQGDKPEKAALEVLKELTSPFLSEDILTSKLLDLARNKRKDGGNIYNEEDLKDWKDWDKVAADCMVHMYEAFEPGFMASGRRIYKGATKQESSSGIPYSTSAEIKTMATGFRVNKLDANRSLYYRALDYRRSKTDASRIERKRGESAGYKVRNRALNELYDQAWSAMKLGVELDQVKETLKNAGVSGRDINDILKGRVSEPNVNNDQKFEEISKKESKAKLRSWIRTFKDTDNKEYHRLMRRYENL